MSTPHLTLQTYQNLVLAVVTKDRLTDAADITAVGDGLLGLLDRHPRISLVLDIHHITAMSSAMLGKLVALHKGVIKGRGRLALCGMHPNIKPIFEITKLLKLFDCHPDAQQAILLYQRKPL